MGEKRYTLRISEELFDMAKICATKENRSIAKEIELALSRYYLMLPFLELIFKDYEYSAKNFKKTELDDQRKEALSYIKDTFEHYRNIIRY